MTKMSQNLPKIAIGWFEYPQFQTFSENIRVRRTKFFSAFKDYPFLLHNIMRRTEENFVATNFEEHLVNIFESLVKL